jgi:hypothetical protein
MWIDKTIYKGGWTNKFIYKDTVSRLINRTVYKDGQINETVYNNR